MPKSVRVFNETRGFFMNYKQALRGIENCAFTWVEEGKSVRNLSVLESIAKRNEQAKNSEPLPYSEIPGIIAKGASSPNNHLIQQAHEFCASQI